MKKSKRKAINTTQQPNGINLQQLFHSIYRNRYWFILFGTCGLAIALLYNFIVPQAYSVTTTLVVKTDNSQATLTSVHPTNQDDKKSVTVQNQIGILSSYTLNLQTLQNLKWDVSWAQKGLFVTKDLYKNAPYNVSVPPKAVQITDVPLTITQVNANQYTIKCDEVVEKDGSKHKINFSDQGYFNKPFKNSYFNFTLTRQPGRLVDDNEEFTLTFNDLTELAKNYQQELKIKAGEDESNLIYIELVNRKPERAIDYLNELDKVYIKYGLAEKNRLAANTVTFINNQISGISDSLQSSGNSFSDYRASNNVVDINQQSSAIVNDMDKIQSSVSAAQMKLDYFKSLKRYLNNASAMKSLVAPSVAGVSDPSLNSLVTQLSDLFRQREVLSYTAQENSPQLIELDKQIAFAQRSLAANTDNQINNTEREVQHFNQQMQSVSSQQSVLPKTEQKLNSIKRNLDFNNGLYTYLLQKRSEAQIAQASRDPDAQILDEASYGTSNHKGFSHIVNLLIGIVLGLLIPLIYLTGKALFKGNLAYVSDIENQLQPSIIGNIMHNKFDTEIPVFSYPNSDIAESFRGLRINIQYLLKNVETKVISVHSSIAGEGKTFVSANLAAIIAMNNKSVLLIDADLRKPRSHKIFKCDNKVGLSTYLKGTSSFSEIIRPTEIDGLDLVPSGPQTDFPSELLSNGMLDKFMDIAKGEYEYIIFNNSPLSIVKDAMMMVPYSDMNLFLLRIKSSSVNQLTYINQLVQEGIVKNVVVALNNVTADSYAAIAKSDHGYYNNERLSGTTNRQLN
jgi:tyrosine-protein kinase Etk/Wzc